MNAKNEHLVIFDTTTNSFTDQYLRLNVRFYIPLCDAQWHSIQYMYRALYISLHAYIGSSVLSVIHCAKNIFHTNAWFWIRIYQLFFIQVTELTRNVLEYTHNVADHSKPVNLIFENFEIFAVSEQTQSIELVCQNFLPVHQSIFSCRAVFKTVHFEILHWI